MVCEANMKIKYAVGLWLFGQLEDRFAVYHPAKGLRERFQEASKVKGAEGLEVIYPAEFTEDQIDEFKSLLKEYKLEVAGIIVDVFTQLKWVNGSFTSRDEKIRKEAVEVSKKAVDAAKEIGCKTVSLWLGQDGYDYPFQADYLKAWDLLVQGVREVASYNPDIRIAVEYKPKEPRTHIFIGTVGKALALVEEVGLKNVGVTMDFGHALYAGENPAESAMLLHRKNRLFHIHFNDNYRDWDHDLLTLSVNLWEALELFYWLNKINYNGWISLDIYPYREDPVKACTVSIENLKVAEKLVEKIGVKDLDKAVEEGDSTETMKILRKIFD